jgi:predicted dehydrogenase
VREHILIIGGGSIGERHIRNFLRHEGVRCSLAEPDTARRDLLQRAYGLQNIHSDWEAVDLADVDGVVICTPTNMHVPMLSKLAVSGGHILCEKPLAMSIDGLDELSAELAGQDARVGVAFCWRLDPIMEELRKRIQDGDLGYVSHATGLLTQFWPDMRSSWPPQYAMRRETGGGVIQDHMVHWINLLEWFFGPATEVASFQRHMGLRDIPTEDFGTATFRFADERLAVLTVCMFQHNAQTQMEVVGREATARFDIAEQRLQIFRRSTGAWESGNVASVDRDDLFYLQAGHFLECIRGEAEPRSTIADATQTLKTVLAAVQSSDTTGGFVRTDAMTG